MIRAGTLAAVTLLAGIYVLVCALVVVVAAILGAVVPPMVAHGYHPKPAQLVAVGLISVTAALGYAVLIRSVGLENPFGWVEVSRTDAPALWNFLGLVAEQTGTRCPQRVRLTAAANAEVREDAYLLGLMPGERVIYIGIPLLAGLPADQLRAVLCHEFGHYTRKATRLSPLVYRGSCALDRTRERLQRFAGFQQGTGSEAMSILGWYFFSWYSRVYDRVTLKVRRRQEIEADAEAARIAGAAVMSEALRTVAAITVAWQEFLSSRLRSALDAGSIPADPFALFGQMLDDDEYRPRFEQVRVSPPQPLATPHDSHPSLTRRLELLGRLRASAPGSPMPPEAGLAGAQTWRPDLTRALLLPADRNPAPRYSSRTYAVRKLFGFLVFAGLTAVGVLLGRRIGDTRGVEVLIGALITVAGVTLGVAQFRPVRRPPPG